MAWEALHPAVTAVPVGIAFGMILERAGLGDPRVIRGQLIGTDYTVILVMFGAIVTAMLGLLWGDALGVVDLRAIATPPTDIRGQVVGGIIFGGGFAISSLCPGTACVAAASGRRDGIAAVGGVFVGTIATPLLWPWLGRAAADVPDERRYLPAELGLPTWAVAAALVLLAIAALRVSRWRMPLWREETAADRPAWWKLSRLEVGALTLALAFAAVDGRNTRPPAEVASLAGVIEREEDHVDAVELATWIKDGKPGLRVIDLREGVDTGTYVIPGAELASLGDLSTLRVGAGELVVLYSDGGAHAAQGWVLLQLRGVRNARVLKDGMAAWEDDVLEPILPAGDDAKGRAERARVRALSLWFGGRPHVGDAPFERATRSATAPRTRRRRTC